MADNSVFITGAAEGAFVDALNGLPPWATENTAIAIEKQLKLQTAALSTMVRQQTSSTNASNGNTGSELEKAMKAMIEQTKKDTETLVQQAKEKAKKDKKDKKTQKDKDTLNAGRAIAAGVAAKLIKSINGAMEDNIKTYAALQQGGINVVAGFDNAGNGFTALQQVTLTTGVRFTELSATMLKYSTSINAFTTGKFTKTVNKASEDLYKFGFTNKESAELLGSYLEAQSGYTDITNKSEQAAAASLTIFAKGLSKVSAVTGMAKNAILSNMEAISKSNEASVLSTQVGNEAATATLAFISSIKNQQFGKTLLKMMTDQIKPLNATFMSFQKIGAGGFMSKFMNFTQSLNGMSEVAKNRALKDYEMRHHVEIENIKRQANLYSQFPEMAGAANEVLTTIAGMQQTTNTMSNLSDEQLAKLEKTNEARSRLSSAWEKIMSKFQSAVSLPISLLGALATTLEALSTVIDNVSEKINKVLGEEGTSWVAAGLSAAASLWGVSKASLLLGSTLKLIGRLTTSSGIMRIGNMFNLIGNLPGKFLKIFSGSLKFISKIFSFIGPAVLRFAGLIGWLVTAFEAGHALGTKLYDLVKDWEGFANLTDAVFAFFDKFLQYIPGSTGDDAKERIDIRKKVESDAVIKQSQIAISTSPAPSTIDSPSATIPQKPVSAVTQASPAAPVYRSEGKDTTGGTISDMMAATNTLLQELLDVTHRSVSVNKDILRYTKVG